MLRRDETIRVQQQQSEKSPLPLAAEMERLPGAEHFERAEETELERVGGSSHRPSIRASVLRLQRGNGAGYPAATPLLSAGATLAPQRLRRRRHEQADRLR